MKKLFIIIILIFIFSGAFSQAPPPAPIDSEGSPLSDNLIFLLMAGILYAVSEFKIISKSIKTNTLKKNSSNIII